MNSARKAKVAVSKQKKEPKSDLEIVAEIVHSAGGKIVGRTRLQKIGYLLHAAGFEDSFSFEYRHYGPYSEGFSAAIHNAAILDFIDEVEKEANWGGTYSIYKVSSSLNATEKKTAKVAFIREAASADPVELELAATAAFLASREGLQEGAWEETQARKPEKAQGNRLENAKALYQKLAAIQSPNKLPAIV
ncbi:MAG: hypothetical protein JNM81_07415 [Rhodospirillaceae bacterium]|nr:hypothetical protein [Rhodospirillaceae bacterium]